MDPVALASLLKDGSPWALVAILALVIKFLYDYIITLHGKIETLNIEWRRDSQTQSEKLTEVLSEQKVRR